MENGRSASSRGEQHGREASPNVAPPCEEASSANSGQPGQVDGDRQQRLDPPTGHGHELLVRHRVAQGDQELRELVRRGDVLDLVEVQEYDPVGGRRSSQFSFDQQLSQRNVRWVALGPLQPHGDLQHRDRPDPIEQGAELAVRRGVQARPPRRGATARRRAA
jgi:hypothetical protein